MHGDLQKNSSTKNGFYLFSVLFSLFVFLVRPGEFIPALENAKLLPVSMVLTSIGFVSGGGLRVFRDKPSLGLQPALLLLLLAFISIFFSVWPGQAFTIWRSVLLINTLLLIFWLPAALEPGRFRLIVLMIAIAAVSLACALLIMAPTSFGSERLHFKGTNYDPNDIALVLATIFPLLVFLFLSSGWKSRVAWGGILFCVLVAIIKTGSRGGILSIAVTGLLFLVVPSRLGVPRWSKIFLVVFAFALFTSPVAEPIMKRWQKVFSGEDYNLYQTGKGGAGRIDKWRDGAKLFFEHPVIGVGIGNSGTALGLETNNWLTIHNSYLQIGMELGVVGLLLFLGVLLAIWRNCTRALRLLENSIIANPMILLAAMTRIALVTFMVGAFFLSQAYSILVPILLVLSNGIYHVASADEGGREGV